MISFVQYQNMMANTDPHFLEDLAGRAREVTIREFGRTISLYAPLYLASYCDNNCLYCGFRQDHKMKRYKLSPEEMDLEMRELSHLGIQNVLLLTGESRSHTPPAYLEQAVDIAKNYFPSIALEVYPLETDEYRSLFRKGVDGVTIYQETYDRERYKKLHPKGKKSNYNYRYETPRRIAEGGMRMISMGVLLGLSPVIEDTYQLFLHIQEMERTFPGIEYSLSFPRIIPVVSSFTDYYQVDDVTLVKLICIARILFPRLGINLSTRENQRIRDHALQFGVTRISAASRTTVGGYYSVPSSDPQFEVQDRRSVNDMIHLLKGKGFDPVLTDWRRIPSQ